MIQKLPIYPAFQENNLPVVLDSSDSFAPYASVTILSVIDHASPEYNYDFLVLTWDMKEETAQKLAAMAEKHRNVSIRVIDVNDIINRYKILAESMTRFNRFGYVGAIRINLPTILKNFDMALHLDSDLVVCADISELFRYDMSDYYIGWVPDVCGYIVNHKPDATVMTDEYMHNRLGLNSAAEYMNGGVFLLHVKNINRDFTQKQIIEFGTEDGALLPFAEQDTFSGLFAGHKLDFPFEWNWQIDDDNKLISNGKRFLPYNDGLLDKYYRAEKDIKCYHYIGSRKPWTAAKTPYDEIWWEVARNSPFSGEILAHSDAPDITTKVTGVEEGEGKKYLLFICYSGIQLINAMNIKYHYYREVNADLMIVSGIGLTDKIDEIKKTGMFDEIIISSYTHNTDYYKIRDIPVTEKSLHPEKYEHMPKLDAKYTDMFIAVFKYHFNQMIYYYLVNAGKKPCVHIYDEGGSTYIDNLNPDEYREINHSLYPDSQQFRNNITNIFLCEPSLYCGLSQVRTIPIPKLSACDHVFSSMLFAVFGQIAMPEEKYLFFSECFAEEGYLTNEIEILDAIANIVGKENIAIKVHPRSEKMEKIYRLHGYRLFSDKGVPWELSALSPRFNSKVLMSISSNSSWMPLIISDEKCVSISLLNVMKLAKRAHAKAYAYQSLLRDIQEEMNKNSARFFIPNSMLELKNIIRYIEGEA